MYQQQRFEHIVVTRPDTAALKPRGPVVRGSTTLLPQRAPGTALAHWLRGNTREGGRSDAGERYIKGGGDGLMRHVWVQGRTEDRTGIRSQDGPLQPSPVPEEADGPHGCQCVSMLWVSLHYIF